MNPVPKRLIGVSQKEWDALDERTRTFLIEAHDGHFCYFLERGEVCAWGAAKTSNLFSMRVIEEPGRNETLYTLPIDP